jgi:hypothetical protein
MLPLLVIFANLRLPITPSSPQIMITKVAFGLQVSRF